MLARRSFVLILTYFAAWIFSPSPNPILINGMMDAKQMLRVPQDPSSSGAIPIIRSVNDAEGLEFGLQVSCWLVAAAT